MTRLGGSAQMVADARVTVEAKRRSFSMRWSDGFSARACSEE